MKWNPWGLLVDIKPPSLPIEEPPCKYCLNFNPVAVFGPDGTASKVKCCHTKEMYNDFSCYISREKTT